MPQRTCSECNNDFYASDDAQECGRCANNFGMDAYSDGYHRHQQGLTPMCHRYQDVQESKACAEGWNDAAAGIVSKLKEGQAMKITAWIEKHRSTIEDMMGAISAAILLIYRFIIRILGGAGTILGYLFLSATPETTVYQLSQMAHTEVFWKGAVVLAVIYSLVLMVLHGSISGREPARSMSASAKGTSSCGSGTAPAIKGP